MKWINIIALAAVITVNALANSLPINDLTTGEVAALYPNWFTPAGITFSIWIVIYIFLAGYCIFPFIVSIHKKAMSISHLFVLSCFLNCSWIFAWHYLLIEVSVIIMLLLLVTLCIIYQRINQSPPATEREKWMVYKPFSIYLAWISVATVANVTAFLVHYNFSPPSPEYWAITMVIAILLIVYFINRKYHDIAFSLVVVWALIGIIIKRTDAELLLQPLVIACIIAIVITVWMALHYRYRKALT